MKISIVSAYYNRKQLLYNTLKSISLTKHVDFEYVVVDDASVENERIEDLSNEFDFLKVKRIDEKQHINPCVPYNIGFNSSVGDIIIIQNPECLHGGDILTFVDNNITENNYISFSTYALTKAQTSLINGVNSNIINQVLNISNPTINSSFYTLEKPGWYNHSKYRPVGYHFCSAIHRNNLKKLNGFDERFKDGISYDDDEFLFRLRKLNLNISINDNLSVFHQFHEQAFNLVNSSQLIKKNADLFNIITKNENIITANNRIIIE